MKAGQLVSACEELVKTYKSGPMTAETHAFNYFQEKKINDEDDRSFLQEVFYGCLQYKKLLKVPLSAFFFNHPQAHKVDSATYQVILYLGLLRLDELGIPEFARLVRSQDLFKMDMLLGFVFDLGNVDKWLKDEWLKLYDEDLVYNQLINPLTDALPELSAALLEPLHSYIATGISNTAASTIAGSSVGGSLAPSTTKPMPFNLTKPRPRMVEPPQKLKSSFKARPVPATTREPDNLAERISKKVEEEHAARMKMYAEQKTTVPERLLDNPKLRAAQEAEEREAQELAEARSRAQYKAKPAPVFKPTAPVRLNTAAVLREDALYQRKQAAEMAQIQQYHAELRDASEFLEWQAKMKAKDDAAKFEAVKNRKKASEQAQLEAKAAMERKAKHNRAVVSALKKEDAVRQSEKQKEIKRLEKDKQRKRTEVKASRAGAARSAAQIKLAKKKAAQELVAQQRELEMQRAEEIEYERQRRKDKIMQIKALEKVPKTQVKAFDPNERTDHGLLGDMSLTELKNRLELNKHRDAAKVQERRDDILAKKAARQADLLQRAKRISAVRDAATSEAKNRRSAKKVAEDEAKLRAAKEQEAEMELLAEKLREKRAVNESEQQRLRAEAKAVRIKNQFLSADHRMVEEAKWKELEAGRERDAKARQQRAQALDTQSRKVKAETTAQREKNANLQAREARKQQAARDEHAARAKAEAEEEARQIAETKRLRAQAIKQAERERMTLTTAKI